MPITEFLVLCCTESSHEPTVRNSSLHTASMMIQSRLRCFPKNMHRGFLLSRIISAPHRPKLDPRLVTV